MGKSRIAVVQQLLQQVIEIFDDQFCQHKINFNILSVCYKDIVTKAEYHDLMMFENGENERNFQSIPNTPSSSAESGIVLMDTPSIERPTDDIQVKSNP